MDNPRSPQSPNPPTASPAATEHATGVAVPASCGPPTPPPPPPPPRCPNHADPTHQPAIFPGELHQENPGEWVCPVCGYAFYDTDDAFMASLEDQTA